jgi:hypothetical protein
MCPKIDVMERECKNYNIWNASKRGLAAVNPTAFLQQQQQQQQLLQLNQLAVTNPAAYLQQPIIASSLF